MTRVGDGVHKTLVHRLKMQAQVHGFRDEALMNWMETDHHWEKVITDKG